ncbi:MAG TPA: TRAP transporter large permease subunit [bacterium]|nr:TRAP transporter large permease subunit [bacterium]
MSAEADAARGGGPLAAHATGDAALRMLDRAAEAVIVLALLGEVAVIFLNVLARAFLHTSILWTEEVAQIALSVLAYVGGTVAYRRAHHTFLRVVLNKLPPMPRHVCLAAADWLVLALALTLFYLSLAVVQSNWPRQTPILGLPGGVLALPLTISMPLLAVYALENLRRAERTAMFTACALLAATAVAVSAARTAWLGSLGGTAAAVMSLALLLGSAFLGLPIGFALVLAACGYFWVSNSVPLMALPQQMVHGTGNFVLLALPFFIFAGLIMERGGISVRLVRFVYALVGHVRGGLLQVAVISMYLVSGLSGSKIADVAAVGTVMRDMIVREGYGEGEGAAVLASAAVMGDTVPPSIGILVLGSITSLSIAALFIGGLLPAAVIGVCLMALIYLRSGRANVSRAPRAPARTVLRAALGAVLPIAMPFMIFAGILSGTATPTEVSSFAVIYGLILASFVYRELGLAGLVRAAIDSAMLAGLILFILAAATSFSWALTIAYLPQHLVALLEGMRSGTAVFLVGSIVLLIVTGSLLEGLPALNILAPLLVPMAGQFGLNGLHFGIVLLIAMGLGAFLPPTGVGFYACCAIMRTRIEPASRAMMPYLVVLIIGLLIVSFVPWFTLVLPQALGFGK